MNTDLSLRIHMKLGELESFKNPQVPSHPTSRPNNGTPPNPKRATGRPGSPGERLESSRLVCQLLLRFCANPGTDHAHVARLCAVPLGETTGQAAEVLGVGFGTLCQQLLSVHFFSAWAPFYFFWPEGFGPGRKKGVISSAFGSEVPAVHLPGGAALCEGRGAPPVVQRRHVRDGAGGGIG